MEKNYFSPEKDGFDGVYYPNKKETNKVIIAMLGDSSDDRMAVSGVKWLHKLGCNVLALIVAVMLTVAVGILLCT